MQEMQNYIYQKGSILLALNMTHDFDAKNQPHKTGAYLGIVTLASQLLMSRAFGW